jgi:hypothetical protein
MVLGVLTETKAGQGVDLSTPSSKARASQFDTQT